MTTINEIERLVIEFEALVTDHSFYPLYDNRQIWLVLEQHAPDKPSVWRMLNHDVVQPYSLIQGICSKEAIQAELKERTCNGRPVSAEAYIGLWRSEMFRGVSFTKIAQRDMFLSVTFTISTQYLLDMARDDDRAGAEYVLSSPNLVKRDDLLCTWQFNLDCLEACKLFCKLHSLRSYGKPFAELYSKKLSWLFAGKTDASPSQQSLAPHDLFAELEVTL